MARTLGGPTKAGPNLAHLRLSPRTVKGARRDARLVRTAIVATVRNEAARIGEFLASLEAQTRIPDIVVVTDGGSSDGTQALLEDFARRAKIPFRWFEVPGNRSKGRNAAIAASEADLIAMTDASVLEPTWFERIITPLED